MLCKAASKAAAMEIVGGGAERLVALCRKATNGNPLSRVSAPLLLYLISDRDRPMMPPNSFRYSGRTYYLYSRIEKTFPNNGSMGDPDGRL